MTDKSLLVHSRGYFWLYYQLSYTLVPVFTRQEFLLRTHSSPGGKDRCVQVPLFPLRFGTCPKHTICALPNCKVRASGRRAGGRVVDRSSRVACLRYYIGSTRTRSRVRHVADAIKRHRTRLITLPNSFRGRTRHIQLREDSIVLSRQLRWKIGATCSNGCHALASAFSHLKESIKE